MSNSTEMVERVARALLAAHDWTEGEAQGWDAVPPDWQDAYRKMARAAIEAMREPTPGMVSFGLDAYQLIGIAGGIIDTAEDHVELIYQAVVSAALSPEDEGSQRK